MLTVLQVCNVGQVVGGTAACAWSAARALPEMQHHVAFLGTPTRQTRETFGGEGCRIYRWKSVTAAQVASVAADVVILHNASRTRAADRLPAVTIQFLHSKISPARSDLTLYCSRWLAEQYKAGRDGVCLQGVPRPLAAGTVDETRALRRHPIVGRLCTPQAKKWPPDAARLYDRLARCFPEVLWEFVGCPSALQAQLRAACRGRAEFLPACWQARSRLWHWDALLYHNPHVTESFGRTVAEAMRAGCIPVVDDRGGFREQVTERCGFLCKQPDEFEQALHSLRSAGVRRNMSRACRAYADEQFSLARFGDDLRRWIAHAARSACETGAREIARRCRGEAPGATR